jgi:hypothetical protein
MAIKDRDGNVYKLRGPNPLCKDRSDWDKTKIKLINLKDIKTEIIHDENNPLKKAKQNIVNISERLGLFEGPEESKIIPPQEFMEEAAAVAIEEPLIENSFNSPTPGVTINVNENVARILQERGVECHCVPVIGYKKIVDDLYGSSYSTPKYGTQFLFDAIIIDQSDLQLQIWCIKELTKDSIIHRKNKQGGERWWRVTDIEPKTGGFLCLASISDVNPDFS